MQNDVRRERKEIRELQKFEKSIGQKNEEVRGLTEKVAKLEAQVQSLKDKLDEKEAKNLQQFKELTEIEIEFAKLKGENKKLKEKRSWSERKDTRDLAKFENSLGQKNEEVKGLTERVVALESEVQSLKEKLDYAKLKAEKC